MTTQPHQPDSDEPALGFTNIGVELIEIGASEGEIDLTVRPLRDSLRRALGYPPYAIDSDPSQQKEQHEEGQ